MSSVRLDNIQMKRESKSFTDSLYAVLTAANRFEGPKYMLSVLSGMAFKFTVHERLLSMSVSAYGQWGQEHRPAIDNLGVLTEWDGGRTRHPTFSYYQKEAIQWIKHSLDQGVGVIYWIPEFGVIHGYDDEDQVLFVQDGKSPESTIVLYDNLGVNTTPFWYVQTVGERVAVDKADMVLESLRLAIHDWDTPHKTLPNVDIASGKLAYDFLIRGLAKGDYDDGGAVYILASYVYSRREIISYLSEVRHLWPELNEAYATYGALSELLTGIESCLDTNNGVRRVQPSYKKSLCELLGKAQSLEHQAVGYFRMVSNRYPDLKRSTVPRWGVHTPK